MVQPEDYYQNVTNATSGMLAGKTEKARKNKKALMNGGKSYVNIY